MRLEIQCKTESISVSSCRKLYTAMHYCVCALYLSRYHNRAINSVKLLLKGDFLFFCEDLNQITTLPEKPTCIMLIKALTLPRFVLTSWNYSKNVVTVDIVRTCKKVRKLLHKELTCTLRDDGLSWHSNLEICGA